jgi:hypothetical protein
VEVVTGLAARRIQSRPSPKTNFCCLQYIYISLWKLLLEMGNLGRARLQCDGAEDSFRVRAQRTSPCSLLADTRGRQFSSLLASALEWLVTPLSCFPFTSPLSRRFVPSHSNRILQN